MQLGVIVGSGLVGHSQWTQTDTRERLKRDKSRWSKDLKVMNAEHDRSTRVLVIDDEPDVARGIQRVLERDGYHIDVALEGQEGLALALSRHCDLAIIDIMLPNLNGFQICASLRQQGMWAPILMLSAKTGEWDQAESLEAGADDYLTKPVSMIVLRAHVRALLRRAQLFENRQLTVDGLTLDPLRHTCGNGQTEVALSVREVELLAILMLQRHRVVPKPELISRVWGTDFEGDENIVEVYVGHLRRKLERPLGRRVVDTIRGSGYAFHQDR
jgi:DNA-binding response OmpR family regulator